MSISEMLTYGNEAGFDPPIEADLGYELWASLRYSMLNSNVPNGENEMPDMATFSTKGYGFFLSEQAPESLCDKANMLFSEVYLGCIHWTANQAINTDSLKPAGYFYEPRGDIQS